MIDIPRRQISHAMESCLSAIALMALPLLVSVETQGAEMPRKTPSSVTRQLFLQWRSPRLGAANPERMNNPVWEWLVKTKLDAYQATERMRGPSAMEAGPGWCFDRFGQSSTKLPDGREILIAGEHEDAYDPDFYIYNDVVVRNPNGRLDIFGYPRDTFQPTDFHSATLVSNQLVLIGNLGYPEDRQPGRTPVALLDLTTFAIAKANPTGTPPGWIHSHKATLSPDGTSILIQGGKLETAKKKALIENIDDWRLHLADWRWERLTDRKWSRWEVRRKDGELNHLFDYQQAVWSKQIPGMAKAAIDLGRLKKKFKIPSLEDELHGPPDLELYAQLYKPPVPHQQLPNSDEEFGVHRISVESVVVRYVQDMGAIQMTIEGKLPKETMDALTRDLLNKLSKLERAPCVLNPL